MAMACTHLAILIWRFNLVTGTLENLLNLASHLLMLIWRGVRHRQQLQLLDTYQPLPHQVSLQAGNSPWSPLTNEALILKTVPPLWPVSQPTESGRKRDRTVLGNTGDSPGTFLISWQAMCWTADLPNQHLIYFLENNKHKAVQHDGFSADSGEVRCRTILRVSLCELTVMFCCSLRYRSAKRSSRPLLFLTLKWWGFSR